MPNPDYCCCGAFPLRRCYFLVSVLLFQCHLPWRVFVTASPSPSPTTRSSTIYIPIPDDSTSHNDTARIIHHLCDDGNDDGDCDGDFPRGAYAVNVTPKSSSLRVVIPDAGPLVRVTSQAALRRCDVAVNGGPFHADGTSVGVLILNGTVIHDETNGTESLVGIGRTKRSDHKDDDDDDDDDDENSTRIRPYPPYGSWVLGAPPSPVHTIDFDFFVTGFGWLVRDGANVVPSSHGDDTTGAERAPRTAVGVTAAGHLVFVVTDGCERWYVFVLFLGTGESLLCRRWYRYVPDWESSKATFSLTHSHSLSLSLSYHDSPVFR